MGKGYDSMQREWKVAVQVRCFLAQSDVNCLYGCFLLVSPLTLLSLAPSQPMVCWNWQSWMSSLGPLISLPVCTPSFWKRPEWLGRSFMVIVKVCTTQETSSSDVAES